MKSSIYQGQVRHRRFTPKNNEFNYSLFMLYLDLDELPHLFKNRWLWSSKRFALAWFRRKDHLFKPKQDLATELKAIVKQASGQNLQGPIRLLTHLRYFGYCFNPISLYYCFDKTDSHIECVVAEVHNTPWGERHCYVLHENQQTNPSDKMRFEHAKAMHVSPFMKMDMQYKWFLTQPKEKLTTHIENQENKQTVFDATLSLERQAINGFSLAKVLALYPFMTLKIILLIHYQALRLWLKRVPFVQHPNNSTSTGTPTK